MQNFVLKTHFYLLMLILMISYPMESNAGETCRPSGHVRGRKPPRGQCMEEDDICCIPHRVYSTYTCSPPVSAHTNATLTLTSFEKGGDGAGPSKCDSKYHSDNSLVVALSTGWYKNGDRCRNFIRINNAGNGRSVKAMVVDECDSSMGCDKEHEYLPPCKNNVVVASEAVWKALEVPTNSWGEMQITWTDAA